MSTNAKRKAIFIDRDGTLIEEVNFLSRIEDLRFFSFTEEAVRILKDNDYLLIVVTNQSGIGRGIYSEADMHSIHDEIQRRLSGAIDAFYFCPHLPDAGCDCRKPSLGMIESGCADFDVDLTNSWMIGDKKLDVETGVNASLRTVMVLTGYGENDSRRLEQQPDVLAKNLLEAAKAIADFKYSEASSN